MLGNHLRAFFQKFSTLPAGVPAHAYRFYVFSSYFYFFDIFAHGSASLLNFFLGLPLLGLFNIGSMLLYALALHLNLKGFLKISLAIFILETLSFAVLQSLSTPTITTFPVLILVVMVIFFSSIESLWLKAWLSIAVGLVYAALGVFVKAYTPTVVIEPNFNYMMNFIAGCIIICIAIFIANFFSVGAQTAEVALERERQRSENLLLNILPQTIIKRLKSNQQIIADRFDCATVLFADIVNFTPLSEQLSPENLVITLNKIFTAFDDLTDKYHLEKIKTIGDSYMVAAGVPKPRRDHPQVIADFALDMLNLMVKYKNQDDIQLDIRIGISSGPVIAGIIGKKKFVYDLWGDTVNTASRMESNGLPSEIQVSPATYNLLAGTYLFEERGVIDIKGKGKMKVYLLKGKNPDGRAK